MFEIKPDFYCNAIGIQGFDVGDDIEAKHLFLKEKRFKLNNLEQIGILLRKISQGKDLFQFTESSLLKTCKTSQVSLTEPLGSASFLWVNIDQ